MNLQQLVALVPEGWTLQSATAALTLAGGGATLIVAPAGPDPAQPMAHYFPPRDTVTVTGNAAFIERVLRALDETPR